MPSCRKLGCYAALFGIAIYSLYFMDEREILQLPYTRNKRDETNNLKRMQDNNGVKKSGKDDLVNKQNTTDLSSSMTDSKMREYLPPILFKENLYSDSDFVNDDGIIPTFWNETEKCFRSKFPHEEEVCTPTWGPCYLPKTYAAKNWNKKLLKEYGGVVDDDKYHYLRGVSVFTYSQTKNELDGLCRPGFLIIGQGKCGTSSLYHYLTSHPRVLPASEKQIHYFKYYSNKGMRWYLSHFPTTESFLSNGGLMTGEASPGYLPYPDVVERTAREMPGTRIINIGRDPLDRSYSSYRYNYVNPALEKLRKGKTSLPDVPRGKSDEYYIETYLYSFEDMMRAELVTLQKCFGESGIVSTRQKWNSTKWGSAIFDRREKAGLPPLIDLDGQCYGNFINSTVPKAQWNDLVRTKPGKYLNVPNLHLSQAMIGRSLYVYPLEWWYEIFAKEDIYFLCTEEMKDMTGQPIATLATQFLGLPPYDFGPVVQQGAYNVGGHKGYDKVTTWDTVQKEEGEREEENDNKEKETFEKDESIPLSPEFKKELFKFLNIHNERLFEVIGRRCTSWATAA